MLNPQMQGLGILNQKYIIQSMDEMIKDPDTFQLCNIFLNHSEFDKDFVFFINSFIDGLHRSILQKDNIRNLAAGSTKAADVKNPKEIKDWLKANNSESCLYYGYPNGTNWAFLGIVGH